MGLPRHRSRLAVLVTALLAALLGIAGPASAAIFVPATPVAGWGTNGTVYAVLVTGDTVVVGGSFTAAVSTTGAQTARANLAAFSLSTGKLLTGWRADTDGSVRALATDGSHVWVGGDFTTVAGTAHHGLAEVSVGSGALSTGFTAQVANGGVRALKLSGASLYVGGSFTTIGGSTAHGRLAKLSASTGAVDSGFTATVDAEVRGIVGVSSSSRIYVAGRFTTVNGSTRAGLVAVNATTGAVNNPVFSGASTTLALDINADGTRVYAGQMNNAAVAYSTNDGRQVWSVRTDGDIMAIRYIGNDKVLAGFHDGYQGDTTLKALAIGATSGAVDPDWRPSINNFDGVWAIGSSSAGVVLGGAFTTVSGVSALHLAFFRP